MKFLFGVPAVLHGLAGLGMLVAVIKDDVPGALLIPGLFCLWTAFLLGIAAEEVK